MFFTFFIDENRVCNNVVCYSNIMCIVDTPVHT